MKVVVFLIDKLLSLAPISNLDPKESRFRAYRDYLDKIYGDPTLLNIALIGNRGSGKSSIIHSYDKLKNEKEEFLYVSLIDFEEHSFRDGKCDTTDAFDRQLSQKKLEYSLLCQVLARCTKSDLCGSTIVGIPEQPPSQKVVAFWFSAVFALIFGLLFENRAGAVLSVLGVSVHFRIILHGILYLVLGVSLSFLLFYTVWKIMPFIRINKVIFKGPNAEADFSFDSSKYYLDQYRFELIFILNKIARKIGYTVVFEDMERLDSEVCVEIMSKLRELNSLVNTHRSTHGINPNESIRFIYALSDEVFDYETRTKFFDTIVPVIPALNATNAQMILRNHLMDLEVLVDKHYMNDVIRIVAPAITEYRTLRNIINEFVLLNRLYTSDIGKMTLHPQDCANLLALTVYKVLFPQEYAYAFGETGNAILPQITLEKYRFELVDMAHQLFQRGYLHDQSLKTLAYAEERIVHKWLNILESRNSGNKITLLQEFIEKGSTNIREGILARGLFEKEADPYVAGLFGVCIFETALVTLKNLPSRYQMTGELFIKYIACLSSFPEAELEVALEKLMNNPAANIPAWTLFCLSNLDISEPLVSYLSWDDSLNNRYIPTAILCLGYERKNLTYSAQNKKIGRFTLAEHIALFEKKRTYIL